MSSYPATAQFILKDNSVYNFKVKWDDDSLVENDSYQLDNKLVNRIYFSDEFDFFFDIGIKKQLVFLDYNPSIQSSIYLQDELAVIVSSDSIREIKNQFSND